MTFAIPIIQFDFSAGKDLDEIKRCLYALYSTVAGTQPLDREFGLGIDCLDRPAPVAKNLYTLEVIKKTDIYEPRVAVKSVTFKETGTFETLAPVILVGRRETTR